jgi:hypothetical protein
MLAFSISLEVKMNLYLQYETIIMTRIYENTLSTFYNDRKLNLIN